MRHAGGVLTNRFGRRKLIILAGMIFTLSAIGTALAPTIPWLIAGMVVSGLAIGIASFISPMYIAELVPANVRGALVAVNMLAITTGIVIAYLVDYAFSCIQGWRYMFGLAAIPSLGLAVGMWRLPDSPRWLISKSRLDQAKRVLQRVRTVSDVSPEIADIQESMKKQGGGGIAGLLQPSLRMPLIVGLGLAIFQQITGINTVIYYAPTIFKFAGIKAAGPAILAGAGLAMVMWCLHVLSIFLLDRVGRRPLLFVGVAGQILGLAILGRCVPLPAIGEFQKHIAIGSLVIYVASFRGGTRADLLAVDFRNLSLKGSWCGHERRDSYKLGNEPGGIRDIPDPGRCSGGRRNFLVIRRDSGGRMDLLLSSGAGNQRKNAGTD